VAVRRRRLVDWHCLGNGLICSRAWHRDHPSPSLRLALRNLGLSALGLTVWRAATQGVRHFTTRPKFVASAVLLEGRIERSAASRVALLRPHRGEQAPGLLACPTGAFDLRSCL